MTIDLKIQQLREEIKREIIPLIKSDYVLYSLPYYPNIGDTLIWEGCRTMLHDCSHKCVGVCGWDDYPQTKPKPGTTILILGGGFFGDVWRRGWQNVLDGIKGCEDYPIVFLPQSIFYENAETMAADATYLANFKNLTICTRDLQSYEIAKQHFKNPAILVPDLAFYINTKKLRKLALPANNKALYLKRLDKEFAGKDPEFNPSETVDVSDWPTIQQELPWVKKFNNLEWRLRQIKHKNGRPRKLAVSLINQLYLYYFRKKLIKCAVDFLSPYNRIVTTRLHVMILTLLLNKPVEFLDNSYGKNSGLYNTWLKDVDLGLVKQL